MSLSPGEQIQLFKANFLFSLICSKVEEQKEASIFVLRFMHDTHLIY